MNANMQHTSVFLISWGTMTRYKHLQPVTSSRGFLFLPPIPSEYGGEISVYESSAAGAPHIWVRATSPTDMNNPELGSKSTYMLLTLENAEALSEQLAWFVKNHYQHR